MHGKSVCHRDIKLDNIIFDEETLQVKIIDLGFAQISNEPLKVFCGTPSYMSPEIVSKKEYSGQAADIWAIGVVLYVLLTGMLPFRADDEKNLFRKI